VWDTGGEHPAIWGYDLFNEPWGGVQTAFPAFERDTLTPFYQDLIDRLRTRDTVRWALVEPDLFNTILPCQLEPLDDSRVVYAPHIYSGGTALDSIGYWVNEQFIDWDNRRYDKDRDRLGWPVLVGEYGITSCVEGPAEWTRDSVSAHDRYTMSETVWVYSKDDCGWGLLDAAGNEKPYYLPYLIRPYPRAVAGHIESYDFDFDTGVFELVFTNTAATGVTEIYAPARQYPGGFTVECSDPAGTWSSEYDDETQVVSLQTDPDSPSHTVTVMPAAQRNR